MAHYLKNELYELIKKDEKIFNFIQEGSLDGLWYWDLENPENEWMNPKFWEVLGYDPKEMPHKASAWQDIINQDDLQRAINNFNKHVADPKHPYDQEVRYTHKNGSTVWVRCRGLAIRNTEGKAVRMLGAHQDITSLKQAEDKLVKEHQRLKDSEEKYRHLSKEAADNLMNLQAATNITTLFLDKNLNVFEFAPSDHTKKFTNKENKHTFASIASHFQINGLDKECKKVLASLNPIEKEVACIHGLVWWMRISPYKTLEGNIEGLVITFTDISEKKQQEAELEKYRSHLEELVEEKSHELLASNTRYKQLVETAVDAIYLIDENGIVIDTNHQATLMLEKSKDEIIGQNVEVIDPNFPVDAFLAFWDPIPYDETQIFETTHIDKAGRIVPIEISGKKYKLDEKTYYYGIARDISERKRSQKEILEKQYHLENAQLLGKIGSWDLDIAKNELVWTDENYRVFGVPIGTPMTYELFLSRVHPDDREYVDSKWNAAMQGEEAYDINHRLQMDDGEVKWVREKADLVFDDAGKCIRGTGFTQDITESKLSEQKLQNSEKRLKEAQKIASMGYYEYNIETGEQWWSEELYHILEFDVNKPSPTIEEFSKRLDQENIDNLNRLLQYVISTGKSDSLIYKIHMPSSSEYKYISTKAEFYTDEFNAKYVKGTLQDVTERIHAEKALKESEEKYRNLVENLDEMIFRYELQPEPKFTYVSPNSTKLVGYTPQEHYDDPFLGAKIIHPDDTPVMDKYMKEGLQKGESVVFRWIKKNGEILWTEQRNKPIYNKAGEIIALEGIARDITEKVIAERRIKENEERYKKVSELSSDYSYSHAYDENGNITLEWSFGAFEQITGYTPEEGATMEVLSQLFHPDDIDELGKRMEQILKGETVVSEVRIIAKNGDIKWIKDKGEPEWDKGNNRVIRCIGTAQEITDQKNAENKLQASESKFRSVFEDSNVGIAIGSAKGTVLEVNDEYLKITGYNRNEFINLNFAEITHPEDLKKETLLLKKLTKGEIENYRIEKRLLAKNGAYIWLDCAISGRRDPNGKLEQTTAMVININDVKKANETIKVFFDQPMNIHLIGSIKGDIQKVNKGWEKTLGYSIDETLGKNIMDYIHPDDKNTTLNELKDLEKGKTTLYFENRYRHKNGHYITLAWSAIYNTSGKLLHGIAKDITQQKAYHEALLKSEENYKALSENAKHIILTHNFKGEITYANKYALEFMGLPKEKLVELNIKHFIQNPDEQNKMQKRLNDFLNGKSSIHQYELNTTLPTGEKRVLEVISSLIKLKGKEDSVLITAYDISDRKEAELKEQKKLLIENLISRISTNFIQTENIDNTIKKAFTELSAINNASRIYLFEVDEKNGTMRNTHEWCAKGVSSAKKDLQNLPIGTFPWWMKKMYANQVINIPDVSKMPNEAATEKEVLKSQNINSLLVIPIFIKEKLYGYVGFDNIKNTGEWDSSDTYLLEMLASILSNALTKKIDGEKIRDNEEKLRLAVDNSPLGITIYDMKGKIISTNKAYEDIVGYSKDELQKISFFDITHPDYLPKSQELFNKMAENKAPGYAIDKKYIHKDGHFIDVRIHAGSIKNEKGENLFGMAFTEDITWQKKSENDLIEAKEAAEKASRLKSEFLHNVSHEVRTPMNGIIGFSNLLKDEAINHKERCDYVEIINKSSNQLLHIIDEILEISRLDTSQVHINHETFDLYTLLEELHLLYEAEASKKSLDFSIDESNMNQNLIIKTDKTKLYGIINNFLMNAFKFTKDGFVKMGYKVNPNKGNIQIYVSDSGIGIEKENIHSIFERFEQEEKELSQKSGGLGLGLPISLGNARLLDGDIHVESKKGKGSTFYLTLPYSSSTMKRKYSKSPKKINIDEDKIILIAEDEDINYFYLETLLTENDNFHLLHAQNGQIALNIYNETPNIDLILMDLKMPEMSGLEATEKIRITDPDIPIIAITAYSSSEDKKRALDIGCNDFLSKPFEKGQFNKLIEKYLL